MKRLLNPKPLTILKIYTMKNLFTLFVCALSVFATFSASAQCTVNPPSTEPGLYPLPDSIDCFVQNEMVDYTVQFVNFDSAEVTGGIQVRVDYIIIDSILNLPCGMKWTTSAQDKTTKHRFDNKEQGCIRFVGYANDQPGQYNLSIKVKAKVSLLPNEVDYLAEDLGFRVSVRVKANDTDPCPAIDTSSSATLMTAACTSTDTVLTTGINELAEQINDFRFYPNPTTNVANVSFVSDKFTQYTTRIVNIFGQEMSRETLNVEAGLNTMTLDVSAYPAGVYMYTINDGKAAYTHRFVVE